ncbi:MAG: hypothetical protein WD970_00370 [Patescibacteria group bacterium]
MEETGAPAIYLPPNDLGSWPTRLNYAFGIGVFTDGDEVEAQRRGRMLGEFADSWTGMILELGPAPNEEDVELLRSLMRDNSEIELIPFTDYIRAAEAPEGTREHAALGYYENSVGYPASFHDPLLAHSPTRDQSLLTAEILASQMSHSLKFFTALEETPFRAALHGTGFGQLVFRVMWGQITHIVKSGSHSQRLDDWLAVAKNGWVYLGYSQGTMPRFLHQ